MKYLGSVKACTRVDKLKKKDIRTELPFFSSPWKNCRIQNKTEEISKKIDESCISLQAFKYNPGGWKGTGLLRGWRRWKRDTGKGDSLSNAMEKVKNIIVGKHLESKRSLMTFDFQQFINTWTCVNTNNFSFIIVILSIGFWWATSGPRPATCIRVLQTTNKLAPIEFTCASDETGE